MAGLNLFKTAIVNEEIVYSIFCGGIVFSLIFWPLLNSILCIGFFLYWLLFVRKDLIFFKQNKYWIALFCLLYLVIIVSVFYSANTKVALSKLQHKSAYILFPLIFGTSKQLFKTIFKTTALIFLTSTLLGIIICLSSGVYHYYVTGVTDNLYGYSLVNPLRDMTPFMMGMCCVMGLLFSCDVIYKNLGTKNYKHYWLITINIISIIFLFLFLLLLGNRNILIIGSGLLLYYLFKLLKKLWIRLTLIVGLLLLLVIAIKVNPFLNKQWNEAIGFSNQSSLSLDKDVSLGKSWGGWELRKAIWQCSWDVAKRNPFWGVGVGDIQDSLQSAYEKRKFYFASRYNRYNTHNQYLQEIIGNGAFGLAVFLLCLIAPLFAKMPADGKEFYGLFIFCFAFGCITDTPLELNKGIILYSFFNAFIFFKNYKSFN